MPLIDSILEHKTISIVGMYKNTGKTETLNYILGRLPISTSVAITSIGIDGERIDLVSNTAKPEILLRSGSIFATAESLYNLKSGTCEIINISRDSTALGRVITARIIYDSKVIISGASSSCGLRQWIDMVEGFGTDITLIDGALSRLSSASPAICEAMILTTGAALCSNISTLVSKTAYTIELIRLPRAKSWILDKLRGISSGIWGIDGSGNVKQLPIDSAFSVSNFNQQIVKEYRYIFISGAITDRFIKEISQWVKGITIVVQDFSRIFISEMEYRRFIHSGGNIEVLNCSKLLAITVNPTSPSGYNLDSQRLCDTLSQRIQLPVYDILN